MKPRCGAFTRRSTARKVDVRAGGASLPRSHRRLRRSRPGAERDHHRQPARARDGRANGQARSADARPAGRCTAFPSSSRTTFTPPTCRRPADRSRSGTCRRRRWVRREAAARCRRDHPRQGESHELARAGTTVSSLGGQTRNPVRPDAHAGRIERRHRRGDRRELRRARHRQRHRPVDPIAVIGERPRRLAADARAASAAPA